MTCGMPSPFPEFDFAIKSAKQDKELWEELIADEKNRRERRLAIETLTGEDKFEAINELESEPCPSLHKILENTMSDLGIEGTIFNVAKLNVVLRHFVAQEI